MEVQDILVIKVEKGLEFLLEFKIFNQKNKSSTK